MTPAKPRRGRPPKPGGRGDNDRVRIALSLTKIEAKFLDALRGVVTRSEYIRRHLGLDMTPR